MGTTAGMDCEGASQGTPSPQLGPDTESGLKVSAPAVALMVGKSRRGLRAAGAGYSL